MPAGSACKDGSDRCGAWGPESLIVDFGLVTKLLVALAFPAFLIGGLIVKELGRAGISEVYSFMISMPLLISAWFYIVGSLIDNWKRKPSTWLNQRLILLINSASCLSLKIDTRTGMVSASQKNRSLEDRRYTERRQGSARCPGEEAWRFRRSWMWKASD